MKKGVRVRKRPILRIGSVVEVRGSAKLIDYLPFELCDVNIIEGGGWGIWSGNVYRGWGVLSVLN